MELYHGFCRCWMWGKFEKTAISAQLKKQKTNQEQQKKNPKNTTKKQSMEIKRRSSFWLLPPENELCWELLPELTACVQKWVSQHTTICTAVKMTVKFRSYPTNCCAFCMWWSGIYCWFDFCSESEIPGHSNSEHSKVILKCNQSM